jgi:hypothetical protein
VIAEVVILDYWADRIEILLTLGSGFALGWMLRMLWDSGK